MCPLLGGLSSFGVSIIGGFTVLIAVAGQCPISSDMPGSTSCVRPGDANRDIPFQNLGGGQGRERFDSGTQVIVTSYTFKCCGVVTLWRTYVEPGGGREDGEYDITFQVWRPIGVSANQSDCYQLVGENTFHHISVGGSGLVCEIPAVGDEIAVRPGDVVGFYTSHGSEGRRGVQIDDSYESESVWYGERLAPSGDSQCVGSTAGSDNDTLQLFTNHAPILSVTLGTLYRILLRSKVKAFNCHKPVFHRQNNVTCSSFFIENETCLQTATTQRNVTAAHGSSNTNDALITNPLSTNGSPTTESPPSHPPTSPPSTSMPATTSGSQMPETTASELIYQTAPTASNNTDMDSSGMALSIPAVVGIIFGGVVMLFLLTQLAIMAVVCLRKYCHLRTRKCADTEFQLGLNDTSLSYNVNYHHADPVLLDGYSRASNEGDYAAPSMLRKHPVVTRTNTTSTCHYVEPNAPIVSTSTLDTTGTCSAKLNPQSQGNSTTTTASNSGSNSGSGIFVTPYAVSGSFTPQLQEEPSAQAQKNMCENIILKANKAYGSPQKYVSILS